VLGALALIYGGFTYTRESHDAEIGPVEIEYRDRERVHVPLWVGLASLVAGIGLVVTRRTA
jgi:hypothetical protein